MRQLGCRNVQVIAQPNAGKPAALNRGITEARHDILVLVDGDTIFQPDTLDPAGRPAASILQSARSAATLRSATVAASSAGGSTSNTSWASTWTAGCSTCSAPSRRCPAPIGAFRRQALARRRRAERRHAGRGHRPDHGHLPVRLAGDLRAARRSPGPRLLQPAPAVAAAVPVVLRDHAVDVEAPAGHRRARAVRQVRPPLPDLSHLLPRLAAAGRAGRRRRPDLRADLPQPAESHRVLAGIHRAADADLRVRAAPRP